MFKPRSLLFVIILGMTLAYASKQMENSGLVIIGYFGEEYHIFETMATYSFIIACVCIGLFLVYGLTLLGGISSGERKEEELIFTKNELIEMDKEDEPSHNESHRQTSSASWDGGNDHPVYEDYRGKLRNVFSDEIIHDNRTDKRRIVNGKVSDKYSKTPDGRYKMK